MENEILFICLIFLSFFAYMKVKDINFYNSACQEKYGHRERDYSITVFIAVPGENEISVNDHKNNTLLEEFLNYKNYPFYKFLIESDEDTRFASATTKLQNSFSYTIKSILDIMEESKEFNDKFIFYAVNPKNLMETIKRKNVERLEELVPLITKENTDIWISKFYESGMYDNNLDILVEYSKSKYSIDELNFILFRINDNIINFLHNIYDKKYNLQNFIKYIKNKKYIKIF